MKDWKDVARSLNTHEWSPVKDRTAILFIDCQEYFRGLISPILENIIKVIEAAHKTDVPLFFTQHGHKPNEEPGLLGDWWADIIVEGSESAQLLAELGVRPGDTIIKKDRYSAFYKTDLEQLLREKNIKDLIIGGVMTNLCCETTARDAFVRDFRVFFLADGTSTATADFHLATLKNLSYGFATLMTCDRVISSIL
jgi:isochorismate hydrolase